MHVYYPVVVYRSVYMVNFLHFPVITGSTKSNRWISSKQPASFLRENPSMLLKMDKIFSARARLSLYIRLYRILSISSLSIFKRLARFAHCTMRRPNLDISRAERRVCSKSSSVIKGGVGGVSTFSLPFCLERNNLVHWLVTINNKNSSGLNSCKIGRESLIGKFPFGVNMHIISSSSPELIREF